MEIKHIGSTMVFLVFALTMVSCTREDEMANVPYTDYVELHNRGECPLGEEKRIAEMAPSDVIVAVNGYPLTKQEWDDRVVIEAKFLLRRRGSNQYMVDEQIKEIKNNMTRSFVMKRLLIDDAKSKNVLDPTNVFKAVNGFIFANAKASKKTVEQLERGYPGDRKYLYYDVAERIWIDALIATNIPPIVKVDAALVSNAQAQVAFENDKVKAVNEKKKGQLAQWKADVETGKAKFEDIANKYSADADNAVGTNGYWCVAERGEMSDKKLQAVAFALPLGGLSDPVEDENGIHVIKVNKITPQVKNAKGRIVQKEIRELSHIYLEKEPMIMAQSDKAMAADLKRQMQLQAVDKYVENLKTNGFNKVVYPHGKNLF